MTDLPIAFPAEAAGSIARSVFNAVGVPFWPWIIAAIAGPAVLVMLLVLLIKPLRTYLLNAWSGLLRQH